MIWKLFKTFEFKLIIHHLECGYFADLRCSSKCLKKVFNIFGNKLPVQECKIIGTALLAPPQLRQSTKNTNFCIKGL